MHVICSRNSSEESTAPDVGCLGVCITLGRTFQATLQASGYSAQDLWDKGSRQYGVSSQKQDGVAPRAGVTLSGLLKHHNRPHVHGYWHGFEAILNTLDVFNITKQACAFPQTPPLWSPKGYCPAQTPQHCSTTISFLPPSPQCPKSLLIATGPLKRRLIGKAEYFVNLGNSVLFRMFRLW